VTDAAANLPANRLRASAELREATQIALNTALEDGQLDYQEMQERAQRAVRVTYRDEITNLLSDLSFPAHLPAATDPMFLDTLVEAQAQGITNLKDYAVTPAPVVAAHGPSQGQSVSMAIFGGSTKKGAWICAPKHTAFCAFGGVTVDLRNAQLTAPTTVINVASHFGGVDVVVPEDYRIMLKVLPVFGGSAVRDSKRVTINQTDLPANAPVIEVRGYAAFGGVSVRRVPR
jgi:hypothetical protein